MFYQASLLDIPSVISSPALASGLTPCAAQAGPTAARSGLAPAPVNLSARQAKEAGLLTSGTYGQRSTGSSASEDLMLSLVNRLKARTDVLGSTLFKLTWKQLHMHSGRSVCVLRASARRTSGEGFSSWPTPCQQAGPNGGPNQGADRLPGTALLAGWQSPTVTAIGRTDQEAKEKRAEFRKRIGRKSLAPGNLEEQVILYAPWATPAARDFKSESATDEFNQQRWDHPRGKPLSAEVLLTDSGQTSNGCIAKTENSGQLNPAFSRWLMGLPPAWDDCAVMAMPSSRRLRKNS